MGRPWFNVFLTATIALILGSHLFGQVPTNDELLTKYFDAKALYVDAEDLRNQNKPDSNRAAIIKYESATEIFIQIGSLREAAVSIHNAGYVCNLVGEKKRALEHYDQTLVLLKGSGDKGFEAMTLNDVGMVYRSLGEMQKALESYDQALLIRREIGAKSDEAATLNNIGLVYDQLGEKRKALEYYDQALRLLKRAGDKEVLAAALHNIGSIYDDLGEKRKALELYNKVLKLERQVGRKDGEASTLQHIGYVYNDLGEKRKALEYYAQALQLQKQIADMSGEAVTLASIGSVYDESGEKTKALEFYNQALPLTRQAKDKRIEAATLNDLMFVWESFGYSQLAIIYGKQSVNLNQELRSHIQGLDKEIQKTFLRSLEGTYRKLADILITQSRVAEAEQVLGMLKEEEYFSFLRRDSSVAKALENEKISLSADERKAIEEYEKFAVEITRTASEFEVLETKQKGLPLGKSLSAEDQIAYDRLKLQVDSATTVFTKFLESLKARFGNDNKQLAAVESDTVGLLKSLNQPHTVIISTITGEDRLNLIVTTSAVQTAHTVDIKAADLNKLVLEFRNAVQNPRVDPRPIGNKLYEKLFPAELQKDLANLNVDTIIWSLDGSLRYVPMAALWDGTQFLAERYQQAVITLASRDKLKETTTTSSANWQALGVGVSKAVPGQFSALPAVPRELCSVISDAQKQDYCAPLDAKGVFGGLLLPDDEFTLQNFERNLGKTSVVHIASHFSLNPGNETDSYLLLGGGTERRFSLDKLRKTRLDNIELLTLSACNTAMTAGNKANGVEIEGFGALAMNQGARSVLAALWAVADESTSAFMSEFYRLKKSNPQKSKAEAVRATQEEMIDGKIKASGQAGGCRAEDFGSGAKTFQFKCDPNAPFSHPYFWSPFILIGNWR
jgi:CHAT domain-containing protein/Tfp pilus assembly protein PilF